MILIEIIMMLSILFWVAVIVGVIYLIRALLKRNQTVVYVPVNVSGGNEHMEANGTYEKKRAEAINNQNQKIALPQQHEIRYMFVKDIVRCEASDNYTYFTVNGTEKILISKSLKEFADNLKPHGFLRTHQSHLVNPSYVKSWLKEDGGMLLLLNGDKVPVSKPNREMVKDILSS